MPATIIAAASALALAAPLHAKTIEVAAGDEAQSRLQEALIEAEPGDVIQLGAGRFVLTDGLSLDVPAVTLRGAGPQATVLDFTGQQGAGEGLLVTSNDVTLRDFAVENPHGDGIKSKGADRIIYYRIRVTWTGGPKETNGSYGIYPVSSTGVLVDSCEVSGASDAGIYVGQSRKITVRRSAARENVAGIEIENRRDAVVENNFVSANTGGILVFDLPNLPVMGGGRVVVRDNLVAANNTPNFAPKGNIVAGVPSGTGVMVMANDTVWVNDNVLVDNPTASVMVVSYPNAFTDKRYNPYPREVTVAWNRVRVDGGTPSLPGGAELAKAFGGTLPPVMWDGLAEDKEVSPIYVDPDMAGWSLNLTAQGQGLDQARPGPLDAPVTGQPMSMEGIGAPADLDARIAS